MELRRLDEFEILEAIVHVLDKNMDEPLLNSELMELSDRTVSFISGHILKLSCHKDLVKGRFFDESSAVCRGLKEIISIDETLIDQSKVIAGHMFKIMQQYPSLPSGDLIVAKIAHDGIKLVAMVYVDYENSVSHLFDSEDGEDVRVKLDFCEMSLKMPRNNVNYGAIIQNSETDDYDVVSLEKYSKGVDGELIEFFNREVLKVCRIIDRLDKTRIFHSKMEAQIAKAYKNQMAEATSARNSFRDTLTQQLEVTISEVTSELIADKEQREKFEEQLELIGVDVSEPFTLDAKYIEKKFSSRTIKTDTGFAIKGISDLYEDTSKFEIKYNGDGTVNYLIKGVRNVSEK